MLHSQQDPESPYLGPKILPQWIELDYYRRLRPLRGWRKWVTLSLFVLTGVAAAWSLWPRSHWAHQAGPLSAAHAMFQDDCAKCHTASFQPLARLIPGAGGGPSTPDSACLQCHDGPLHHDTLSAGSHCADCHREHRGMTSLVRVPDGHCIACHHDLKREHPETRFQNVAGFTINHPEFARIESKEQDGTKLKFNHRYHLELDLKALREKGAQGLPASGDRLDCAACHQPDADRRTMLPVNYDRHCAQCHTLWAPVLGRFQDAQAERAAEEFRRQPAPHKEPETVRAELRERLLRFVRANPVVLGKPAPAAIKHPIPGRNLDNISEEEWFWVKGPLDKAEGLLFTQHQLPKTEQLLWNAGGGCLHCHLEANPAHRPSGLPEYERTGIPKDAPRRWFGHSVFRHDSHRMLGCVECHGQATRSELTTDLLLPSIDTCRRCHNGQPAGARTDCAECHLYHNRSKDRGLNGNLTIDQCLRKSGAGTTGLVSGE